MSEDVLGVMNPGVVVPYRNEVRYFAKSKVVLSLDDPSRMLSEKNSHHAWRVHGESCRPMFLLLKLE